MWPAGWTSGWDPRGLNSWSVHSFLVSNIWSGIFKKEFDSLPWIPLSPCVLYTRNGHVRSLGKTKIIRFYPLLHRSSGLWLVFIISLAAGCYQQWPRGGSEPSSFAHGLRLGAKNARTHPSSGWQLSLPRREKSSCQPGLCSQGASLDICYSVLHRIPLPTASMWPTTWS